MTTGILPFIVSVILSFVSWNKLLTAYLTSKLNITTSQIIQQILYLHIFRFNGLVFLVPGVIHPELNLAWAIPAAIGDLVASLLAWVCLLNMNNEKVFRVLLWTFNLWGFADLLIAGIQGPIYKVVPSLGATYFIPVVYVPLLILTHITIFKLLIGKKAGFS